MQHRETIHKLHDITLQLWYICFQNIISWKVLFR